MKLRDLSADQAERLSLEYLQSLRATGVDYLNDTQLAISNGLFFYASNKRLEADLDSPVRCIREYARETIFKWQPRIILEWEPIVNEWLQSQSPSS